MCYSHRLRHAQRQLLGPRQEFSQSGSSQACQTPQCSSACGFTPWLFNVETTGLQALGQQAEHTRDESGSLSQKLLGASPAPQRLCLCFRLACSVTVFYVFKNGMQCSFLTAPHDCITLHPHSHSPCGTLGFAAVGLGGWEFWNPVCPYLSQDNKYLFAFGSSSHTDKVSPVPSQGSEVLNPSPPTSPPVQMYFVAHNEATR